MPVLRCNGTPDTTDACASLGGRGLYACASHPACTAQRSEAENRRFFPKAVLFSTEMYSVGVKFDSGLLDFFVAGNQKLKLKIKSKINTKSYIPALRQ